MIYASLIGLELFHNRRGRPTSEGPSAEEPGRPPGRLVKGWLRAAGGRRNHEAPWTNMTRLNLVATTGKKKQRPWDIRLQWPLDCRKIYPVTRRLAERQQGTSDQVSLSLGGTRVHSESSATVCCLAALSGHISPTPADEVYCAAPRRGCRVAPGMLWQRRRRKAGRATFTIRRSWWPRWAAAADERIRCNNLGGGLIGFSQGARGDYALKLMTVINGERRRARSSSPPSPPSDRFNPAGFCVCVSRAARGRLLVSIFAGASVTIGENQYGGT